MLSKYIQDVPEKKLEFPMQVTEKLDGVMADLYRDMEGNYHIRTRQGKPIPSMQWYVDEVARYDPLVCGAHLIGELYHNYGMPRVANFNKISGRIRQEQEQATEIEFHLFDCYTDDCYKETIPFVDRAFHTLILADNYPNLFKIVPYVGTVQSLKELTKLFGEFMKDHPDAEGVVARPTLGKVSCYKVGRSYGFIKLVPKPTVDLVIKSIEEAKGELQGNAGKVICEYNGQDIAIGLGSITHDIRRDMWLNPMVYIGRTVEVKYKDITEAGVMRMPVVSRFREDKDA